VLFRVVKFVNTTVAQSLLISNVIICAQSVRPSLRHKPIWLCWCVWYIMHIWWMILGQIVSCTPPNQPSQST